MWESPIKDKVLPHLQVLCVLVSDWWTEVMTSPDSAVESLRTAKFLLNVHSLTERFTHWENVTPPDPQAAHSLGECP